MVKVLTMAFGDLKKSKGAVKVNDMQPQQAVSALNDFFGRIK